MNPLDLITDVRDLLLPAACVGCGSPGSWWCSPCDSAAAIASTWTAAGDLPVVASGGYDRLGPVVLACKERQIADLRGVLVRRLVPSLRLACLTGDEVVVPVPTTLRARARRGNDPVAELAAAAAADVGVPLIAALRWRRGHHRQKGLARAARWRNAEDALTVLPGTEPAAHPVVIVDDVLTTGATIAAACGALAAAGFTVVAGAVVCAATPRPLR